jgi:hypothetical protein
MSGEMISDRKKRSGKRYSVSREARKAFISKESRSETIIQVEIWIVDWIRGRDKSVIHLRNPFFRLMW